MANGLMSDSVRKVRRVLDEQQVAYQLRTLSESTRTAQMAADVLGCTVSEIASSLIFEEECSGDMVLMIASGGHRVDVEWLSTCFGVRLRMAAGKRIKKETGFAIGGVPPLAHDNVLKTWMDVRLRQFDTVWAAAGSPFAVFGINPQTLQHVTGATWLAMEEADAATLAQIQA